MIRHWTIACAAMALLAGCTTPVTPGGGAETAEPAGHVKIQFEGRRATRAEHASCKAAGGRVVPGGMMGNDECVRPYADAGKACMGADDCLGKCLLPDTSDAGMGDRTAAGQCEADDSSFGCMTTVEGGRVQAALCID